IEKSKAPPLLYPDFLVNTTEESRIDLNLRDYLVEKTSDPNWPKEVNELRYARLVLKYLPHIIKAHSNLKSVSRERFTDDDFKKIITFAVLGIPDSAFKKLNPEDYWKIGIAGYEVMEELDSIAPEITKIIIDELKKAPAPFCFISDYGMEAVIRAFYLSVILSQHTDQWHLLLANIDPSLQPLSDIKKEFLEEATHRLVSSDKKQAQNNIDNLENSLSKEALNLILFKHLKIDNIEQCASVIDKECYSILLRSMGLLIAVENLLPLNPSITEHKKIMEIHKKIIKSLRRSGEAKNFIVEMNSSQKWIELKRTYQLAYNIVILHSNLKSEVKALQSMKKEDLNFKLFRKIWIDRDINKIEYYISTLERLACSGNLLLRDEALLPSRMSNALNNIRLYIQKISKEIRLKLGELNRYFQVMVSGSYKSWVKKQDELCLTSQFLEHCLKPHWDPEKEKAAIFIFDGMRYDIWDEFLRPNLEDFTEELADIPASSLLPSETHITRKAISAGTFPDKFNISNKEDILLADGLKRVFNYKDSIDPVTPITYGIGEAVRYKGKNLEVYIFELCDKELHKIDMKILPDKSQVPSRPLTFVYEQHIKDIIDKEVMYIMRSLEAGTKIFITADHGFGPVDMNCLEIEEDWLNDNMDCSYRNAYLKKSLSKAGASEKIRKNVVEFSVDDLRMPSLETSKKSYVKKQYASIIFPGAGYSFARPNAHFKPPAYTHGGISVQELLIPMIVLRVKDKEEGLINLDDIKGSSEIMEGEETEFSLRIALIDKGKEKGEEIRVDIDGNYGAGQAKEILPDQILYVSEKGEDIVYRFKPVMDSVTSEERRKGIVELTLTITVKYWDIAKKKSFRKSRFFRFTVRLNSEQVVRRVPASLGNILGLAPRNR
ncbi:MAG: PglZ domain-containing protein, partial [Candidatus Eremiobacterota bacterium]